MYQTFSVAYKNHTLVYGAAILFCAIKIKGNFMRYAVLVLEQPWWDLNKDPDQTSIRYFLDGLSRLDGLPTFYATFYDTNSFGQALQYLVDARKLKSIDRLIVYVASHGAGSRLGNGNAPSMNLRTLFDRIHHHGKGMVTGLILDSCEVGAQHDLITSGMKRAKIQWLLGYGASVDWLTSALINLHVLSVMANMDVQDLSEVSALTVAAQEAMGLFNPFQPIYTNDEDDEKSIKKAKMAAAAELEPITLSGILTVAIQATGKKPKILTAEDIWPELADFDDE